MRFAKNLLFDLLSGTHNTKMSTACCVPFPEQNFVHHDVSLLRTLVSSRINLLQLFLDVLAKDINSLKFFDLLTLVAAFLRNNSIRDCGKEHSFIIRFFPIRDFGTISVTMHPEHDAFSPFLYLIFVVQNPQLAASTLPIFDLL